MDCPTCGKEFKNSKGVNIHHTQVHGESLSGFTHECYTCGEAFESKESEREYCSRECFARGHGDKVSGENSGNWKGGKVTLTCNWCGDEYQRHPSKADRPYCSRACAGKSNTADPEDNPFYEGGKKESVECPQCDTTFEAWECAERTYCSTECHDKAQIGQRTGEDHPRWLGGEAPYGNGWNERKKETVRKRDNRECQNCGRSEPEHIEKYGERHTIHHIQKARHFDNAEQRNSIDNLVTLCKGKCHTEWERMSPLRPQQPD